MRDTEILTEEQFSWSVEVISDLVPLLNDIRNVALQVSDCEKLVSETSFLVRGLMELRTGCWQGEPHPIKDELQSLLDMIPPLLFPHDYLKYFYPRDSETADFCKGYDDLELRHSWMRVHEAFYGPGTRLVGKIMFLQTLTVNAERARNIDEPDGLPRPMLPLDNTIFTLIVAASKKRLGLTKTQITRELDESVTAEGKQVSDRTIDNVLKRLRTRQLIQNRRDGTGYYSHNHFPDDAS